MTKLAGWHWQTTIPVTKDLPDTWEYGSNWVQVHLSEDWLDVLIALMRDPPPEVKQNDAKNTVWSWLFAMLLGDWLKHSRYTALPKIAPLLHESPYRRIALEAVGDFSCSGVPGPNDASWIIPLLSPLVPLSEELDEEEMLSLISALDCTHTPEALTLLRSLRIPEKMTGARHDLSLALNISRSTG